MDVITKLQAWLAQWRGWSKIEKTRTDGLSSRAFEVSIRPCGISELERRETIIGGCTAKVQYNFLLEVQLYKTAEDEIGAAENALWLLQFQQWINAQSAKGNAPRFGTGQAREIVKAENGAIQTVSREGLAIYQLELTIECNEEYKEEEHGEN